jgi:hypothetical protein
MPAGLGSPTHPFCCVRILRQLTLLPKDEFLALKRSVAELQPKVSPFAPLFRGYIELPRPRQTLLWFT